MEIRGAELMTVGDPDGRGIYFSIDDLKGIVSSFETLGLRGRVPLKFGHDSAKHVPDGQPALGWVDNLRVEGDKLLADFTDVLPKVYEAIKKKAYKFVSVEVLQGVQAGTRKIPWVLDAVALLGADQPAFGTLGDLSKLLAGRRPSMMAHAHKVAFSRDRHLFKQSSEGSAMDEREVQQKIEAAVNQATINFSAQLDKLRAENQKVLDQKDAELKLQQVKFRRDQIDGAFNAAIESKAIEPSVRENFAALTKYDNDARTLDVELTTVHSFIKQHSKSVSTKPATGNGSGGDGEPTTGPASNVVKFRSAELAQKRGVKMGDWQGMQACTQEVLRGDKVLAEKYFANEEV